MRNTIIGPKHNENSWIEMMELSNEELEKAFKQIGIMLIDHSSLFNGISCNKESISFEIMQTGYMVSIEFYHDAVGVYAGALIQSSRNIEYYTDGPQLGKEATQELNSVLMRAYADNAASSTK